MEYLQSRQGDRIKEIELKKLLEDDEVPFSEAINPALFIHAQGTCHCDLSCLGTCSCDLAPRAQGRRAKG